MQRPGVKRNDLATSAKSAPSSSNASSSNKPVDSHRGRRAAVDVLSLSQRYPFLFSFLIASVAGAVVCIAFSGVIYAVFLSISRSDSKLSFTAKGLPPVPSEKLQFSSKSPSKLAFDHIVLFCQDPWEAAAKFHGIGFNVSNGGTHKGNLTHNFLIQFQDSSYIELVAFASIETRGFLRIFHHISGLLSRFLSWAIGIDSPMQLRFLEHFLQADAARDFALRSTSPDPLPLQPWIEKNLISVSEMNRLNADGFNATWQNGLPVNSRGPFLINWLSRPQPQPYEISHNNTAQRILGVEIAVSNLTQMQEVYTRLLGIEAVRDETVSTARFPSELAHSPWPIRFDLSNGSFIRLVEPSYSSTLFQVLNMNNEANFNTQPTLGGIISVIFIEALSKNTAPSSAGFTMSDIASRDVYFLSHMTRFKVVARPAPPPQPPKQPPKQPPVAKAPTS